LLFLVIVLPRYGFFNPHFLNCDKNEEKKIK
jgi:hypothetical protein